MKRPVFSYWPLYWAVLIMALLISFSLGLTALVGLLDPMSRLERLVDDRQIAIQRQRGHFVQALYQVEAQAARTGWTNDLQRQAGDLRRALGDLPAAVAHWEAVRPRGAALTRRLAQAYLDLQYWPEAVDSLSELLKIAPNNIWAHYQLGLVLAATDPTRAETHLNRVIDSPQYDTVATAVLEVIRSEPNDPRASMRVGLSFAEQEQWPQAELAFRHAAATNQPYPEALAYTALSRDRQGKDGDNWMDRALALGAESPQVHYLNGLHLRHQGQYADSLQALRQAILLDPNNPAYYAELGNVHRLLYDFEQAEYWLRIAVAASDNAPEFQGLLAAFYAQEGYRLSTDSLESMRQISGHVPEDPELLAGFGWALHTMGDTQSALNEIDAALELAPENPAALYYKGRILADTGDVQSAKTLLQRVATSGSIYSQEANNLLQSWSQQTSGSE